MPIKTHHSNKRFQHFKVPHIYLYPKSADKRIHVKHVIKAEFGSQKPLNCGWNRDTVGNLGIFSWKHHIGFQQRMLIRNQCCHWSLLGTVLIIQQHHSLSFFYHFILPSTPMCYVLVVCNNRLLLTMTKEGHFEKYMKGFLLDSLPLLFFWQNQCQ